MIVKRPSCQLKSIYYMTALQRISGLFSSFSQKVGKVRPRGSVHRRIEDTHDRANDQQDVTFMHPFNLNGMDKMQPAGTYTVETDEELLQTSLPAYRRISTLMRLPAANHGYGADPDRRGKSGGTCGSPSERRTAGRNSAATGSQRRSRASGNRGPPDGTHP
jgi:hypothetical protein